MLKAYVAEIGIPNLAPHDLRRYADDPIMPNLCKDETTMGANEDARILQRQEVRGSSPCAPTICFKGLCFLRVPRMSTFGTPRACFSSEVFGGAKSRSTPPITITTFCLATDSFRNAGRSFPIRKPGQTSQMHRGRVG
jgi:hypothetical protein